MNDHDRDLIVALAKDQLNAASSVDLRARIEAEPELAAEYAVQRAAIEFLRSGSAPSLTTSEREELHTSLMKNLNLAPEVLAVTPERERVAWWQPASGLAVAAVVIAAVVILPGTLSQEGAETELFQADGVTSNEVEADSMAVATAEVQDVAAHPRELLPDGGTITTYSTDAVTLEELLETTKGALSQPGVEEQLSGLDFISTIDVAANEVNSCLDRLVHEVPDGVTDVLILGVDLRDGGQIVHVGFNFGSGVQDGFSFELTDCTLVEKGLQDQPPATTDY